METPKSKLADELERIKGITGLGAELKVVWKPLAEGTLSGEVKNNTVYVYDAQEEKAIETLQHEFLDYCLSRAIKPYREITNRLISMVNEEAYRAKESVVEGLVRLLRASRNEVSSSH